MLSQVPRIVTSILMLRALIGFSLPSEQKPGPPAVEPTVGGAGKDMIAPCMAPASAGALSVAGSAIAGGLLQAFFVRGGHLA